MNPLRKLALLLVIYIEGAFLSIRSRFASKLSTLIEIDNRYAVLEQKLKIINSK